uniref:T-box transcription factor 22 n=1 Tax=Corvus moneduloides TaxID=1196302 RepID=A0A8C3EHF7_CORMO
MQEDLAVATAPRREPCGGRARGAGCRPGWSRRRPPEPRCRPGGPLAARGGWRSAPGLTPSRWKPWWDARPRGRCRRVAMRSPAPAAGRVSEPRRRVGTGGSPARRGARAAPCPGSLPSRPLPFVFSAEKRPKAGAESRAGGVQVELQGSELWRRFHDIGTEMIITKAGRRMFPSVRVKVKGLEPLQQYYIAIDVVPVDSKRYRYGGDRRGPSRPRGTPPALLAAICAPARSEWDTGVHTGMLGGPARTYRIYRCGGQAGTGSRRLTRPGVGQVRLSQLAVDGGGEHGPLLHHPAPLHPPRLSLLGGDLDEANHQLRPSEAHQQRDGRQGAHHPAVHAQVQAPRPRYRPGFSLRSSADPVAAGRGGADLLLPGDRVHHRHGLPEPADHEAEDRQESLRERFSGPRQEQVRAGAAQPPPPAPAGPAAAFIALSPRRGVLDGLLETYPWRTPLALDFKAFGADSQGGSSSSSPVASSGGTPSPLNPLLSPSCSPPTLHLPASNLGVSCPESFLHPLNVPLYYKICPTSFLRQQALLFPSHEKLGATNPHLLPHFMVDMPKLSSLKNAKAEDLNTQCLQAPGSAGQMLYGLHASGNIFPSSPIAREALNCSLHPPYGVYGYNFSVPSRLMNAAGHFKVSDSIPAALRDGRCNHSNWHPTINHCL